MRVAVYTDYTYHVEDGEPHAERAFAVFIARLAPHFSRLTVLGRLDPAPARSRYGLGADVDFVPLPYYRTLARPAEALRSMGAAMWRFWRSLSTVDCVWLLGPNPFAIVFAVLATLRRRRIVLGVRQDYPTYVRTRHPGRRGIRILAAVLDLAFRALARFHPVIVVGPQLTGIYHRAPDLLEIAVSLVEPEDIVDPAVALDRSYDDELRVISVGRLEEEKNPLLLAAVLARLLEGDRRWRLVVLGEGPMREPLDAELARLGLSASVDMLGYIPHGELAAAYRSSHVLLHVSWTEGLPQVLLEAFAAGVPIVATDVGGVRDAVGPAVRLIPAGDPVAASEALEAIAASAELRARLVQAGNDYVATHTLTSESTRVAEFLRGRADAEVEGS